MKKNTGGGKYGKMKKNTGSGGAQILHPYPPYPPYNLIP